MSGKTPDVSNVYTQLEAALCLLARAKGENPAKQYFYEVTPGICRLALDGGVFQVVVTTVDPAKEQK
jgi:hypothetical protein